MGKRHPKESHSHTGVPQNRGKKFIPTIKRDDLIDKSHRDANKANGMGGGFAPESDNYEAGPNPEGNATCCE